MKILFLAPDIVLSGSTGDVWHVRDVTLALSRAGATVLLVAAQVGDFRIPGGSVRAMTSRRFLPSLLALWRWARTFRPDCIYERRISPKLSAALALLLRIPFWVEINGIAEEEAAMQGRVVPAGGFSDLKAWIRRMLFHRAEGVVAVTEGLKRYMIEDYDLPPSRVSVVPNGVDLSIFYPRNRDQARRRLGLDGEAHYLCHVGNLVAWQGIGTLIAAMKTIRKANNRAELLLIGDGRDRPELEEDASKHGVQSCVRFVGLVPREEVSWWISASDVCVMPSTLRRNQRIGSSALKLREYLACEVSVVATNIEGGGPFLEAHGAGLGFEGDDPDDLAKKILYLLDNPDVREKMCRQAGALAKARLSWGRVAKDLLARLQATGDSKATRMASKTQVPRR